MFRDLGKSLRDVFSPDQLSTLLTCLQQEDWVDPPAKQSLSVCFPVGGAQVCGTLGKSAQLHLPNVCDAAAKAGYVPILTSAEDSEDWVLAFAPIGKSASKELDLDAIQKIIGPCKDGFGITVRIPL